MCCVGSSRSVKSACIVTGYNWNSISKKERFTGLQNGNLLSYSKANKNEGHQHRDNHHQLRDGYRNSYCFYVS